jgi:hypothetical protein
MPVTATSVVVGRVIAQLSGTALLEKTRLSMMRRTHKSWNRQKGETGHLSEGR